MQFLFGQRQCMLRAADVGAGGVHAEVVVMEAAGILVMPAVEAGL